MKFKIRYITREKDAALQGNILCSKLEKQTMSVSTCEFNATSWEGYLRSDNELMHKSSWQIFN